MATVEGRKTTLNLNPATARKLTELGNRLELKQTQVIREAIEVRHRLQQEIDRGGVVVIERVNGDRVQILLTGD